MSELGLTGDDGGPLSIDHKLLLTLTQSCEDSLRRALDSITKGSKEVNRVLTIVGYAAAAYLVMAGVARMIEASSKAIASTTRRGGGGGEEEDRRRDD